MIKILIFLSKKFNFIDNWIKSLLLSHSPLKKIENISTIVEEIKDIKPDIVKLASNTMDKIELLKLCKNDLAKVVMLEKNKDDN